MRNNVTYNNYYYFRGKNPPPFVVYNGCFFAAGQQQPINPVVSKPLISRVFSALSESRKKRQLKIEAKREQQRKALPLPETRLEMLDIWNSL